ncbi:MAG: hypothetical protein OXB88_08930 [Bacteriovoracales bacterium]|nr:hypothetical protein [Bacteriovoracales bacterium]
MFKKKKIILFLFPFLLFFFISAPYLWATQKVTRKPKSIEWEELGTYPYKPTLYLVVRQRVLDAYWAETEILDPNKKSLTVKKSMLLGERFQRALVFPPYAFFIWGKGAHGESVVVLDVSKGKELIFKHSTWPVDIEESKEGVHLMWTGDRIGPDKFKEYKRFFPF